MKQKILVSVKTRSKKPGVERIDDTHFKIGVAEAPFDGNANEAVIEAVADLLGIAKTRISIKVGKKHKEKILEIK